MLVLGITGGSGSGKTEFCQALATIMADTHGSVRVVLGDNFYKDQSNLSLEEQKKVDFDNPNSYDFDALYEVITAVKSNNNVVRMPKYNFVTHARDGYTDMMMTESVVIFEGIFMFHNKRVRDLFDYKFFIDAQADERLVRRTLTCSTRGWDMEEFMTKWSEQIQPGYKKFIAPMKEYADLIIPSNTRGPNKFFSKTIGFLKYLLKGQIC